MDQLKQQNPKTLTESAKKSSVHLKKITQLLLSVSVFSLLLSKSYNLSTFPLQLFTHNLDKNYIFLLCNGLLVFVAKFSGLVTSSKKPTYYSLDHIPHHHSFFDSFENGVSDRAEPVEEEDEKSCVEEVKEKVIELDSISISVDDEGEEEEEDEEEEDGDNGGNELMSTEELNKKFDEFIRKMKEEIRIEAHQQQYLIMVK